MSLVSYRSAATSGGRLLDCEDSLVERCLPSLAVLEGCGIHGLAASFRVADGCVVCQWLEDPSCEDRTSLPPKHRAAATAAISGVLRVVEQAIDAAFEDRDEMDGIESALLFVTGRHEGAKPGWVIHCEVCAVIADDHPSLALRLR